MTTPQTQLDQLADMVSDAFASAAERSDGGFTVWEKLLTAASAVGPVIAMAGNTRQLMDDLRNADVGALSDRLFAGAPDTYKRRQTQSVVAILLHVLNMYDCYTEQRNS